MIERSIISTKVREVVEKNKLEKTFLPCIEEFFYRASDQYNWTEYDLNVAIDKFRKVFTIKFEKHKEMIKPDKFRKAFVNYDTDTKKYSVIESVCFDINSLKNILKGNDSSYFIGSFMHEMGHVMKTKMEYKFLYKKMYNTLCTGFCMIYMDEENEDNIQEKGMLINEYAEIINAARLQKGNIHNLEGYDEIQNIGKIILSSLGINEIEFSNLQWKRREGYERFIMNRLEGIPTRIYIDTFDEIIDCIWNFKNDKKQRRNLIKQIDALQTLSKRLFEERFNNIDLNSKNGLRKLAKLSIDKGNRDSALCYVFDDFEIKPSELEMIEDEDIYEKLSNQGYKDEFLLELHQIEDDERIRMQQEMKIYEDKEYDNEQLKEMIYQSFLKYPIKNLSFKDKIDVVYSKIVGFRKRKKISKDIKLLETGENKDTPRLTFVERIKNLSNYKMQVNTNVKNLRLERRNTNEKSR